MIKYPDGRSQKDVQKIKLKEAANRGMGFEHDINISLEYYKEKDLALLSKRPTPINVVKVNYEKGAKITDAYFEKQSTTDYNGVYKGKYIDFEAKSTKLKTSFPLTNITSHQIIHLQSVLRHQGIAFFLISFETLNEIYLLDASFVIDFYHKKERKSIPYQTIKEKGVLIKQGYNPRLYILDAIKKHYFNEQ